MINKHTYFLYLSIKNKNSITQSVYVPICIMHFQNLSEKKSLKKCKTHKKYFLELFAENNSCVSLSHYGKKTVYT